MNAPLPVKQSQSDTEAIKDAPPENRSDDDRLKARLAQATPAMRQYHEIKHQHPDCLLFFRMGDFYELFFEDAIEAAGALNITLTKRGKQGGEEVPMCGVPFHAADSYLARLIRDGFKVAICDQMESPAEAKKRGNKSVVRRAVTRLVTPGTLTEDTLLSPEKNNYLASIAETNAQLSVAWLDLSTGAFFTEDVSTDQDAEAAVARIDPSEVLVEETLAERLLANDARVTKQPNTSFSASTGTKRLKALYGIQSLDSLGEISRASCAAAAAILTYVELTQVGIVPQVQRLVRLTNSGHMLIDPATRRSLELTKSLSGEKRDNLLATIDRCQSPAGARLLAQRLSQPLTDILEISQRHDAIDWFMGDLGLAELLTALVKATPDIERSLQRLSLERGGPRDMAAIAQGLEAADRLIAKMPPASQLPKELASCVENLGHDGALLQTLRAALDDTVPMLARDGGFLRQGFRADFDELKLLRDESRRVIATLQAKFAEQTKIQSLKIKHNKVMGYVIEVPAQHADKVPHGPNDLFIHRQTLANAVRFTNAELAELEAKISIANDKTLAIELEVFEELGQKISDQALKILEVAKAIAILDVHSALALFASDHQWSRPKMMTEPGFKVTQARHPVVERNMTAQGERFIGNDCMLSETDRLWLITGPNMAGKSTFLRQNALIAVLAQMGSFVPAETAEIGIVDRLFSRVGASDDLARGRSTFMVEMVETAAILNQATENSLVILDEIGRGTATYDGLSIAWATLEALHNRNRCRTLFATHYHELTTLETSLDALSCHSIRVKEWQDDIIFLHEVIAGSGNRSFGVQVAKLAGLPQSVVERAKALLEILESQDHQSGQNDSQLSLFAQSSQISDTTEPESAAPSAFDALLESIDPDSLTAREALDLIYKLCEARDEQL